MLVTATASELNDSYCSLAWGAKLAALTDEHTAAQLIAGESAPELSEREAINDALGAAPDLELAAAVPEPVRAAVSYGRPPSG